MTEGYNKLGCYSLAWLVCAGLQYYTPDYLYVENGTPRDETLDGTEDIILQMAD